MNRSFIPLCFVLFFGLILTGCGTAPQPTAVPTAPTFSPSPTGTNSTTPQPKPTRRPTIDFDLTSTAFFLTNPPPTGTPTPAADANGNVTWHPQRELIVWSPSGGDGDFLYHPPDFVLYWDGMLYQANDERDQPPYVTQLNNDEVCKLLNTVEKSGFAGEPHEYNLPFAGASSSYIAVHSWGVSNSSYAQLFWSAVQGAPYYNNLFCRDCPIPSAKTIIRPPMANLHFLIQNYTPAKRSLTKIERVNVIVYPADAKDGKRWPLTSISIEDFWAQKIERCPDEGKDFTGIIAKEIVSKLENGGTYRSTDGKTAFEIRYSLVLPRETGDSAYCIVGVTPTPITVPTDYTLTCNVNGPSYPLLPLNKDNEFWYYSLSGEWGAERVKGENKMRVVHIMGHEKFYSFDAKEFGQKTIQVYPRNWSWDDEFFYVNILPGDYEPNTSFANSIGLQKIDVENEKTSYVFLGSGQQTFAYEFSNDSAQIAYIPQGETPLKLVIVDTAEATERSAVIGGTSDPQFVAAGSIVWAPEDKVLYLAATYEQDGKRKTHIFSVDPQNPTKMKLVYASDNELKLRPESLHWGNAEICPIEAAGDNGCRTTINLNTGEVQN